MITSALSEIGHSPIRILQSSQSIWLTKEQALGDLFIEPFCSFGLRRYPRRIVRAELLPCQNMESRKFCYIFVVKPKV